MPTIDNKECGRYKEFGKSCQNAEERKHCEYCSTHSSTTPSWEERVWNIVAPYLSQYGFVLLKKEISQLLQEEREKAYERAGKEEVRLFMEEIQKRANTIPPNLLLNEVVNYAYERMEALEDGKNNIK